MPVHDLILYDYIRNLQITGPGKRKRAHDTELAAPNDKTVQNMPIFMKQKESTCK